MSVGKYFIVVVLLLSCMLLGCKLDSVELPKLGDEQLNAHADSSIITLLPTPPQVANNVLPAKLADIERQFSLKAIRRGERVPTDEFVRTDNSILVVLKHGIELSAVNRIRSCSAQDRVGWSSEARAYFSSLSSEPITLACSEHPPLPVLTQQVETMRGSKLYQAIARQLASRYDLELVHEVNYSACHWLTFDVRAEVDEAEVAKQILLANPDIVKSISPETPATLLSFEPRWLEDGDEERPQLLDDSPRGRGIYFTDGSGQANGPDYWDYDNEQYWAFQAKIPQAHASCFVDREDFLTAPDEHFDVTPGLGAAAFVIDVGFGVDGGITPYSHVEMPYLKYSVGSHTYSGPSNATVVEPTDGTTTNYWDAKDADDVFPESCHEHGNAVCGILASRQGDGGISGVLPFGKVYPFTIDETGLGSCTTILSAREGILKAFAVRNLQSPNILVANCSWRDNLTASGHISTALPAAWWQLIQTLYNAAEPEEIEGLDPGDPRFMLVCAAGNSGVEVINVLPNSYVSDGILPACLAWNEWESNYDSEWGEDEIPMIENWTDQIITVMAVNQDDERDYSNYSDPVAPSSVTISAPGGRYPNQDGLISTDLADAEGYFSFGGTSGATPIVTGAVALLQSYLSATDYDGTMIKTHLTECARNFIWDDADALTSTTKPIVDFGEILSWIDIADPTAPERDAVVSLPFDDFTLEARVHLTDSSAFSDQGVEESMCRFYLTSDTHGLFDLTSDETGTPGGYDDGPEGGENSLDLYHGSLGIDFFPGTLSNWEDLLDLQAMLPGEWQAHAVFDFGEEAHGKPVLVSRPVVLQIDEPVEKSIVASVISGSAPLYVEFDTDPAYYGNVVIYNFKWDFTSDASTDVSSFHSNTSFTYTDPGTYLCSLAMKDLASGSYGYDYIVITVN